MTQMSRKPMHSQTLFLLGMWLWLTGSCTCFPVSGVPGVILGAELEDCGVTGASLAVLVG